MPIWFIFFINKNNCNLVGSIYSPSQFSRNDSSEAKQALDNQRLLKFYELIYFNPKIKRILVLPKKYNK